MSTTHNKNLSPDESRDRAVALLRESQGMLTQAEAEFREYFDSVKLQKALGLDPKPMPDRLMEEILTLYSVSNDMAGMLITLLAQAEIVVDD